MGHHGYAHGHGHHHSGGEKKKGESARRALWWALVLNGSFLVVEAVVGFYTGSLALLSDAVHMLNDVGALSLALGASYLATKVATPNRSFGFIRAEVLGAFVNSVALVVAVVFIFIEAVERLLGGTPDIAPIPVLIAGVVGLIINLGSAYALYRSDQTNLNIKAALMHMLADAIGSVGAILAAIFIWNGIAIADPIASMFIALLVLSGAVFLLRDSARVLLQFAPRHLDVAEVYEALISLPKVIGVHDHHCWTLDGEEVILSAHLVVSDRETFEAVRAEASELLRNQYNISHSTIQMEVDRRCKDGACSLEANS